MKNHILQFGAMLSFLFFIVNAKAQNFSEPKLLVGQEVALTLINEWKKKVLHDLEIIKKGGESSKVEKGRRPEIKMQQEKIYFNGKELRIGASLDAWEKIIMKRSRCTEPEMSLCIWDELGLSVGVEVDQKHNVRYLNIQISFSEEDKEIGRAPYPDGKPAKKPLDLSPHQVFPGYLELDGYGIDAQTEFWDIQKNANPDRGLDCGLMDCSHPAGRFGKNAHLYMTLDGQGKRGKLRELSVNVAD
jgi:hypothetical protein